MLAETLLKSRRREMLNIPSTMISRKKKMNTAERWNRIELG